MFKGFRDFIMRGNVVDLAVAVVIGAAFGAVITSFVNDVLMPLIAAIFGQPDLSSLSFTLEAASLTAPSSTRVITFLLIAAAVYFIVVLPMNKLAERRAKGQDSDDHGVPALPERDPAVGAQVRVLRVRAARRGGGRSGGLTRPRRTPA